jgi:hypothetical protein
MQSASDWMKEGRVDLSDWVIHFVHARRLEDSPDPFSWAASASSIRDGDVSDEEAQRIYDQCQSENAGHVPCSFDVSGPQYSDLDCYDDEYPWEPDAYPITVLTKIVKDGYLRAGWSFRKSKATIYGPQPAVCFTEMPLYALLDYVKKRSYSGLVDTYAIVLRREELFQAGGRPVIYGLTGEPQEAQVGDPEFGMGYRALKSACLPLREQYRYVTTGIGGNRSVDWTHEREWRWGDLEGLCDPPGLAIWLKEPKTRFSEILILVKTAKESKNIRDTLKYLYDSKFNHLALELDREKLLATSVLAIENVADDILKNPVLRVEDLPVEKMTSIQPIEADEETIALVRQALTSAEQAGKEAAQAYRLANWPNGHVVDTCGYAFVRTYDSHSKVTAALLNLKVADPLVESGGYELHGLNFGIQYQSMQLEEIAANAAAHCLTERLGQKFYMWSRMD